MVRSFRVWNGSPNVLKNVKIDTKKYQGFAFGIGIDRFSNVKIWDQ